MSWSISVSGDFAAQSLSNFIEAASKEKNIPIQAKPGIVSAASELARALAGEHKMTLTSSGHFEADGKGYASVGISIA